MSLFSFNSNSYDCFWCSVLVNSEVLFFEFYLLTSGPLVEICMAFPKLTRKSYSALLAIELTDRCLFKIRWSIFHDYLKVFLFLFFGHVICVKYLLILLIMKYFSWLSQRFHVSFFQQVLSESVHFVFFLCDRLR